MIKKSQLQKTSTCFSLPPFSAKLEKNTLAKGSFFNLKNRSSIFGIWRCSIGDSATCPDFLLTRGPLPKIGRLTLPPFPRLSSPFGHRRRRLPSISNTRREEKATIKSRRPAKKKLSAARAGNRNGLLAPSIQSGSEGSGSGPRSLLPLFWKSIMPSSSSSSECGGKWREEEEEEEGPSSSSSSPSLLCFLLLPEKKGEVEL